jgi:CubicO group peptidase (beta-lactamase class C family)
VGQVLSHTAGFEEYSGADFAPVTREQFIAHMMASKLRSPPGAEEHYTYWNLRGNGGMVSTVGDMFRFYSVLLTMEKLLKFNSRHGRFSPNAPIGLAGSDGIHFFLYERAPRTGITYVIATNNEAFQGPRVRVPLEQAIRATDNHQ